MIIDNYHIIIGAVQHGATLGAEGGFSLRALHWMYGMQATSWQASQPEYKTR